MTTYYPQGLATSDLAVMQASGIALLAWHETHDDGAGHQSRVELLQDPATGEPVGVAVRTGPSEYRGEPYVSTAPAFCLAPKLPA